MSPESAPRPPLWRGFSVPWVLLLSGLAVTVAGGLFGLAGATFFQVLGLGAGVLLAGGGVARRLGQAGWGLEERIETAAMISLAGFAGLLAYFGAERSWDSMRLLLGAAFGVSLVAALVVLLPGMVRRAAISLLVVFHFTGMLVAITSIDPPNSVGPWLPKMAWAWVYRPYLHFLYMSNAYHFYSPDPGPPTHLWFAVRYSDGNYTWARLPDRANSPVGMHYQRMLALPEHTFTAQPRLPYTDAELALYYEQTGKRPDISSWEDIIRRRERASAFLNYKEPIPYVVDMALAEQYREPNDASKKVIASVARHVFWNAEELTGHTPPAGVKVVSVKVYRVVLQVLTPQEMAAGIDPAAKFKHWPYFLGEFDGNGKIIDTKEPFLYWYIPIAYVPKNYPDDARRDLDRPPTIQVRGPAPKDGRLIDFLEIHAAGVQTKDKKAEKNKP
jgi:hypothetical protein